MDKTFYIIEDRKLYEIGNYEKLFDAIDRYDMPVSTIFDNFGQCYYFNFDVAFPDKAKLIAINMITDVQYKNDLAIAHSFGILKDVGNANA